MQSLRKPHSDTLGYVCELKSKHPKLPGHFVIVDRQKGGDWLDAPNRWVLVHMTGDACGCFVSLPTQADARALLKHMAGGGNDADFGQHDIDES